MEMLNRSWHAALPFTTGYKARARLVGAVFGAALVALPALTPTQQAGAHSGGLNAQGCHAGSQPYHCHRSQGSSSASAGSISLGGGGGRNCHPAYQGACLARNAGDYDCHGGSGNGPNYVRGPLRLTTPGRDPFGLDRDNDGIACER